MRQWATGITIVGARADGQDHGMTVNSFTSVSLDPPLVLVSLEQSTRTYRLVQLSGAFSVSILHDGQQAISDRFAGRETEATERFDGVPHHAEITGSPILDDCLAWLDCRVAARLPQGTHTIFIGEAVAARVVNGRPPLLYFRRDYRRLMDP